MIPKQLIIDKNVFQGTSTSKLEEFVQNHFLILPEVLYYECLTTSENKEKLLNRFKATVLAGGYVCPHFIHIVMREANTLIPCGFLVDIEKVNEYKSAFRKNAVLCAEEDIKKAHENQLDLAQKLVDCVNELASKTAEEDPVFVTEMRKFDTRRAETLERFKRWAQAVDSEIDIHTEAKRLWPTITVHFEKFCISDDWFSWHFTRLLCIFLHELWLSRETGATIKKEDVEHDVQDIGYVVLLCRADALLTKDMKLVKPLAKAAFPEKDVFSNLDEVPDEYLCHWS